MAQNISIPDHLVETINRYYRTHVAKLPEKERMWELVLINKGLDIFLKFLKEEIKNDFYARLDPQVASHRRSFRRYEKNYADETETYRLIHAFSDTLGTQKSLKIFIGKDAYVLYKDYAAKYRERKDYVFLPYSRKLLFDVSNGNGYFEIVNIIYEACMKTDNLDDFIAFFKKRFKENEQLYLTVKLRTLKLLLKHKTYHRLREHDSICIIDSGTQGGLIFPFMTVLDDEGFNDAFKLFSCFNWIYPMLQKHVFTKDLFIFHKVEHIGMRLYEKSR